MANEVLDKLVRLAESATKLKGRIDEELMEGIGHLRKDLVRLIEVDRAENEIVEEVRCHIKSMQRLLPSIPTLLETPSTDADRLREISEQTVQKYEELLKNESHASELREIHERMLKMGLNGIKSADEIDGVLRHAKVAGALLDCATASIELRHLACERAALGGSELNADILGNRAKLAIEEAKNTFTSMIRGEIDRIKARKIGGSLHLILTVIDVATTSILTPLKRLLEIDIDLSKDIVQNEEDVKRLLKVQTRLSSILSAKRQSCGLLAKTAKHLEYLARSLEDTLPAP